MFLLGYYIDHQTEHSILDMLENNVWGSRIWKQ